MVPSKAPVTVSWPLARNGVQIVNSRSRDIKNNLVMLNVARIIGLLKLGLWFSVRSLCLCGERLPGIIPPRGAENHRVCTEKHLFRQPPQRANSSWSKPLTVFAGVDERLHHLRVGQSYH